MKKKSSLLQHNFFLQNNTVFCNNITCKPKKSLQQEIMVQKANTFITVSFY